MPNIRCLFTITGLHSLNHQKLQDSIIIRHTWMIKMVNKVVNVYMFLESRNLSTTGFFRIERIHTEEKSLSILMTELHQK